MPLDEAARTLLDAMIAAGPPVETLEPSEAREAARKRRLLVAPIDVVDLPRVENRVIPGPGGDLPVRVYWPAVDVSPPVVVYFHGGGWVLGDLESHDDICRRLARDSNCIVVSVDYRLAPEHKFPAAVEDALAATSWVAENRRELGAGPRGLAVAGDSSGGNLAAAVALLVSGRSEQSIDHQLLIYPVLDHRFDSTSYIENGADYYLTTSAMRWFWTHYLGNDAHGDDARASPLRASDLSGVAPAMIITAEFDPLRDEGETYGGRLRDAGVPVVVRRYAGVCHGFFGHAAVLPQAAEAQREAAAALRAALWRPPREDQADREVRRWS